MACVLLIFQSYFLAFLLAELALESSFNTAFFYFFLLFFLFRPLCLSFKSFFALKAAFKLRSAVREELIEKLVKIGPYKSRVAEDSFLSTLLLEQVDALEAYVSSYIPNKFLAFLSPFFFVTAIWFHSRLVALILLFTAPLIPIFMILIGNEAKKASQKQFESLFSLADKIKELLSAFFVLRRLNALDFAKTQIETASESYRKDTLLVLRLAFVSSAVLEFFASLAIALAAVYTGMGLLTLIPWAKGLVPVPLGSALFILLIIPEFYLGLRRFGVDYHARASALTAVSNLYFLIKLKGFEDTASLFKFKIKKAPELVLRGVYWQNVVKNLNLDILSGQKIALLGPSGSGKSSILNLLMGFYRASEGDILLDGHNLNTLDMDFFRRQIAWLGQRPEWFSGSIRDNLSLGRKDMSEESIKKALKEVYILDFIESLEKGLDTELREGGRGLSGGQLQRLALARAILQESFLWIFDEPTAYLDEKNAYAIHRDFQRLSRDKTLIIATHDTRGLEWMDSFIKIEDGQIKL